MMAKLAYSITEAAMAAGVSVTRIKEALRDGEMAAKRVSPRKRVVEVAELARWLESLPTG